MEFYIELSDDFKNYRYQNDNTWRELITREVLDTDFITSDIYGIIKLQMVDAKMELDGKEWKVNHSSSSYGSREYLGYEVFVHRKIKPKLPSLEQLTSVISQGDDRQSNSLILNCHGFFELRHRSTINLMYCDPTIITRHETYDSENGYVGPEAAKDTNYVEGIYRDSLEHWLIHLECGRTNMYCDNPTHKTVEELINEIDAIEIEALEE